MINNAIQYSQYICSSGLHVEYSASASQTSELTSSKLERLAVARLQHTVNELQTQVDLDRTLLPPTRKIFHCVCDDTALTASIPELKRFIADKSITMIVPFSSLDSLDRLKKGTKDTNIHARESIRYFDRVQTPSGRRQITGVRIQSPTEKYANWGECLSAAAARSSAASPAIVREEEEEPTQDPPNRVKELLNCTVYYLTSLKPGSEDQVFLVTNDEIVREWAGLYNIPTVGSLEIGHLVKREDIEYEERRRHYDYNNSRPPASPGRNRRGGGMGGHGGGEGGGRRSGYGEVERNVKPSNGYSRGRNERNSSPPDYVLRGPPRGVARGRGKLWEP